MASGVAVSALDPSIVGRSITLDDRAHVVSRSHGGIEHAIEHGIGHVSKGHRRVEADRVHAATADGCRARQSTSRNHRAVAAGRDVRAGARPLQVVSQRLRAAHYTDTPRWTLDMRPMRDELVGTARPILLSAFGAVALVLLIACANVANLLLARSGERQQELAVRAAIGASPRRLRRQLLIEAAVLGVGGAIAGMAIAFVALPLLTEVVSRSLPGVASPRLDAGVFLFALAVTLASSLAFGLVPAWSLARTDLRMSLADARPASARSRPRAVFVVGQVAIAFALLVGGGLLVQSFQTMMAIDPGYSVDRRLTFLVSLPEARYPDPGTAGGLLVGALRAFASRPGRASRSRCVGAAAEQLAEHGLVRDRRAQLRAPDQPHAYWRSVSAGYFATMGIAVVDGGPFSTRDGYDSQGVTVIDELARTAILGNSKSDRPAYRHRTRRRQSTDLDRDRWRRPCRSSQLARRGGGAADAVFLARAARDGLGVRCLAGRWGSAQHRRGREGGRSGDRSTTSDL